MAELVTMYKTSDGKLFDKKRDAKAHELRLAKIAKVQILLLEVNDGRTDDEVATYLVDNLDITLHESQTG